MKVSCGTDIIEINRIKKTIDRLGNKFITTIFTEKEIEYCESKQYVKYQHYAARFALKEAIYKALSEIVETEKLTWKNFEVINYDGGKPKIKIDCEKVESIDVSISHCKEYAIATVVVLYK